MKMDFFTSGIFWGTILVLIGLSIILKIVFGLNIPVIRVLFALFLIYWGVKLIMGVSFKKDDSNTVIFDEKEIKFNNEKKEYNTVFGKASIDLTGISAIDSSGTTEINIVFGSADVFIDERIPLRIKSSAAFGAINFPDETQISFGNRVYKTAASLESGKYPEVEINVVFGNANIYRKIIP